jgi:hypothetical protein
MDTSAVIKQASSLLHRIGQSKGHPSPRDCAMASIMAHAIEQQVLTPPKKGQHPRRRRTD